MMGRAGGRDRFHSEYSPRFEERGGYSGRNDAHPSRHLWVGNLSLHATQNTLSEQFFRFGDLENIAYVPGRSFAFVNYKKEEDAVLAMRGLQGFIVAGMPLRIEFAKGDRPSMLPDEEYFDRDDRRSKERGESFLQRDLRLQRRSPEKSYIDKSKGNRSAEPSEVLWIGFPAFLEVDEIVLRRAFSPFGEIERITTFSGRSYAFVRYRSVVAACRAKEALQGKLFNNPRVNICFAKSDVAPAEHGRGSTSGPFSPHFKSNFHPGLSGRPDETFQRDRSLEGSIGEFHMASPRFGSNLERMSGDDSVTGFSRNSSIRTGAGPGPNAGGSFEHMRFQEVGPERRMSEDAYERRRKSPAAERGAPWHDPFERPRRNLPFEESWGMETGTFPLAKKPKTDSFPEKELPEYPFSDIEQEKQDTSQPPLFPNLPGHQTYNRNFDSLPFGYKGIPDHLKNLNRPHAESDGSWRTLDGFDAGSGPLPLNQVKLQRFNPEPHQSPLKEEWKWEGTIAKGGTPVCRARAFPVGKVQDIMLPEFLNCTARTGLDMLAKHYYQAASSWVVFFVPETDADIVFYNEFMHYLGEKQRAAVAKLGEKITLFLVPPSDFSEQVLKVPGKVSISGVILKFQQASSNFSSLHNPLEAMESNPPSLMHRTTDGIGFHDDTSRLNPTSPEFRSLSQGQNYLGSSSGNFTSATTFPPPHKPGGDLPYPGPVFAMEKPPDSHGESRHDQLPHQNFALPSSWSNQMHVPNSSTGSFPPPVPNAASHSFDMSMVEEYAMEKQRVAHGTTSTHYAPETSGILPLPASKVLMQQEAKPQVSSSMSIPLQPEQLAQLAALLGQQKQSGNGPVLSQDGDNKQSGLVQNPSLLTHAPMSSGPQLSQTQQLQQHTSNVSGVQQLGYPGQQSNHQALNPQAPNSSREETEGDPQKRLQATLQLAAALLQQIQQQAKTVDQR